MKTQELPFEALELFRMARGGLSPTEEDLRRGRARLKVAIAGGGVAAGALAAAKVGGAATSPLAIAGVIAGAVAIAGGTGWWLTHRREPSRHAAIERSHVSSQVAAPGSMPEPATATPAIAPATAPPAPRPAAAPARPAHEIESVPRDVPPPPPPPVAAEPSPSSALAHEVELVRTADEALRAGDPARALTIARTEGVEQLAAELAAIEIDALCALGRPDDAGERVAAFHQRFPNSALAERVHRSCAGGVR